MQLTLHIGSHKAGSSAIQEYCVANAQDLAWKGIFYPVGLFADYPAQHSGFERLLHPGREADLTAKCEELAGLAAASGAGHVLLSGEDLCSGAGDRMVKLLQEQLSRHFDDIRIVFIVRDKLGYLISHLKHMLRHGSDGVDLETFEKDMVFSPVRTLNRWSHFFGEEHVVVLPFAAAGGEPLLKRFFKTLFDVDVSAADIDRYAGVNASFDLLSSFLVNEAVKPLTNLTVDEVEIAYKEAFAAVGRKLPFLEASVATMLDSQFPDDNSWSFTSIDVSDGSGARPRQLTPTQAIAYLKGLRRFIEILLEQPSTAPEPPAATGLTAKQVRDAYRLLLDREPESEQAIAKALDYRSMAEFRTAIFDSPEYRARNPRPERLNNIPLNSPPIAIGRTANSATLAKLFAHIQERWTSLGETAPHWSVLSAPQYEGQLSDETADNFYATATAEGETLERILARVNRRAANYTDCFEFGCGVGRMTLQLGRMFPKVTGCDISKSHLELARQAASRRGAANVSFELASTSDFGMPETFDFWYSRIVLQHNPPPMIEAILTRMLQQLRPGGLAVFQVPTYAMNYRFDIDNYLRTMKENSEVEMHCIAQATVFALAEAAGCRLLEVREDNSVDIPRYWVSNNFVFEKGEARVAPPASRPAAKKPATPGKAKPRKK